MTNKPARTSRVLSCPIGKGLLDASFSGDAIETIGIVRSSPGLLGGSENSVSGMVGSSFSGE
jgi:hypothetical protein